MSNTLPPDSFDVWQAAGKKPLISWCIKRHYKKVGVDTIDSRDKSIRHEVHSLDKRVCTATRTLSKIAPKCTLTARKAIGRYKENVRSIGIEKREGKWKKRWITDQSRDHTTLGMHQFSRRLFDGSSEARCDRLHFRSTEGESSRTSPNGNHVFCPHGHGLFYKRFISRHCLNDCACYHTKMHIYNNNKRGKIDK